MRDLIPEKIQDENQEGEGKVKEEYRSQEPFSVSGQENRN